MALRSLHNRVGNLTTQRAEVHGTRSLSNRISYRMDTEISPPCARSWSAGVENFVLSRSIPSHVILTKIMGVHSPIMSEYVLGFILAISLQMKKAFENQLPRTRGTFSKKDIFQ